MTDPGVNVTTMDDMPFDKLLGPLPVVSNIMDTMVMIGLRCAEIRPVTQQIKMDPKEMENFNNSRSFHCLFYIQSARDEVEQNLEVITKHGQLYYRVTRNVTAGEEMLVWYSKDSAELYKVPDVDEFYDKDERNYSCPYCNEVFLFPNPLKAHLMYRCEKRLAEVHGLSYVNRIQLDSINRLQLELYSSAAAILPMKHSLKGLSITSLANSFLDIYRRTTTTAATITPGLHGINREKENSEQSSLVQATGGRLMADYIGHAGNEQFHEQPQKRKMELDGVELSKRSRPISFNTSSDNGLYTSNAMEGGRKPKTTTSWKNEHPRSVAKVSEQSHSRHRTAQHHAHLRRSISPSSDRETSGSAFKKVSKSNFHQSNSERLSPTSRPSAPHSITYGPCDTLNQNIGKPMYPISYSLPLTAGSPPAAVMAITALNGVATTTSTATNWSVPLGTTGSLPTVSGVDVQGIHQQHTASSSFTSPGFISPKVVDIPSPTFQKHHSSAPATISLPSSMDSNEVSTVSYRGHALYPESMYRLSVTLPHAKQFGTPLDNFLGKPPPLSPIAASLLPPSLAALAFPAQNWCAKCNASFRMTSDLVYHMRSHHKRETDPLKKKREDKLKCPICNESFRERHHLTRHMTSHQ